MSKAQMTAISGDTKWRGSGMIKAGLGLILLSLVVILPARNTKAGAAEIIITDDVTLDYIAFSIPKGVSCLHRLCFLHVPSMQHGLPADRLRS
jgi:hypothetical protein